MAKIALRVYNKEISDLIEHGHLEEAIAHCRHILEIYPRLLNTYRLFGKSFLEAKQYDDAADILQRVISSIPDDFVAQIGMSIIREDQGNLNAAIYHMERTFESQPSNQAIQEELRRLYGRRDGVEPAKIRLTRGALGRMYAHGNLYEQAVAELNSALADDPARIDLNVLMAEMYFKMEKPVEAADLAITILDKLPNNLSATKILYFILKDSNREKEAEIHKHKWISLDPYVEYIDNENFDPDLVQPNLVTVEKLIWDPALSESYLKSNKDLGKSSGVSGFGTEEGSNQNWLFTTNANEEGEEEDQYFEAADIENSLEEETLDQSVDENLDAAVESEKPEKGISEDSEDSIPEWILDGVVEPMDNDDMSKNDEFSEKSDDFDNKSEEFEGPDGIEASENDLPDWMQSSISGEETDPPVIETPDEEEIEKTVPNNLEDDDTEWLEKLSATVKFTKDEIDEETAAMKKPVETPDWLKDEVEKEPEIDEVSDDTPDWLKDLEGSGLKEEKEEDSQDWMKDLGDVPEKELNQEETPEWMKDVLDPDPIEEVLEEKPELMKEVSETPAVEKFPEDTPDWMKELGDSEDVEKIANDLPEWLSELDEPGDTLGIDDSGKSEEENEIDVVAKEPSSDILGDEVDWLNALDDPILDSDIGAQVEESAAIDLSLDKDDEESLDWLDALGEEDSEAETHEEVEPETDDAQTEVEESKASEAKEDADTEMDDWLNSLLDEVPEEEVGTEENAEWMPPVSEMVTKEIGKDDTEDSDWLKDLETSKEETSQEEPDEEKTVAEEIPEIIEEFEASEIEEAVFIEEESDLNETGEVETKSIVEGELGVPFEDALTQTLDPSNVPSWFASDEVDNEEESPKIEKESEGGWIPEAELEVEVEPVVLETKLEKTKISPVTKKQISEDLLEQIKKSLVSGTISEAVAGYKKLISRGVALDQVVENINDSLRKYPLDLNIWQVLGDAYMKNGQLQEALDAYSKAEELL